MRIDILTLFPSMFAALNESIIKRARNNSHIEITVTDIRDQAADKHRTVDDPPYGGGPGMVMKADVVTKAIRSVKHKGSKVILMTPAGKVFDNATARRLARSEHIILVCGHYEGIDERIGSLIDEEISIGDFVLTGGEIPAMAIADSVSRFVQGVLKNDVSASDESFMNGLLEFPQYTRPESFDGSRIPGVLTSGDHKKIIQWRRKMSVINTFFNRPDLLAKAELQREDSRSIESVFEVQG